MLNNSQKESVKAGANKVVDGLAVAGNSIIGGVTVYCVGAGLMGLSICSGVAGTAYGAVEVVEGLGMMTVVPAAIGAKEFITKHKNRKQKVAIVKVCEVEEILEAAEVC